MNATVAGSRSDGIISAEEDISAVPRRTTKYLIARLRTVDMFERMSCDATPFALRGHRPLQTTFVTLII
jgi:hypothetical protein